MNKPLRYISQEGRCEGEGWILVNFFSFYREKPYMKDILRRFQLDTESIKKKWICTRRSVIYEKEWAMMNS